MSLSVPKPKPIIEITKRAELHGWRCTEIEISVKEMHEKWSPYSGFTLIWKPTKIQQLTVILILFLGKLRKDEKYRKYVMDWIDISNKKVERLVARNRNDPFGMVEELKVGIAEM